MTNGTEKEFIEVKDHKKDSKLNRFLKNGHQMQSRLAEDGEKNSKFNRFFDNGYRSLLNEYEWYKIRFLIDDSKINNYRNWLAFARDLALGGVLTCVIIYNVVCNDEISKITNLLTTDNGYMSQFALVSLLLGIVPVIMYSKKLKKESKDAKEDKKEEMDKRKIGKDYPYGNKYGKNEEEDKDKFDK